MSTEDEKTSGGTRRRLFSKSKASESSNRPVGDYLREFVFQQNDCQRPDLDLSRPALFGVETSKAEQVFIPSGTGRMGAWFMEPDAGEVSANLTVLYLHGVSDSRGRQHRVDLYNWLLKLGYTVLAIDYRGFGDSTDTSEDEDTVVEDSLAALSWLQDRVGPGCDVLVWGHSMGTGIACHTLANFFKEKGGKGGVKGLVLESPYNNFTDEFIYKLSLNRSPVISLLMARLYKRTGDTLPCKVLEKFNMKFNSDQWIKEIQCPVLMLHAEDDKTVPFQLGRQLYESSLQGGKTDVEFHSFPEELGLGHNFIVKADTLPSIFQHFLSTLE